MKRRGWWIVVVLVALAIGGWFGLKALVGVHEVRAGVEAPPASEGPFSHRAFGEVLSSVVREGRVDYDAVRDSEPALRRYVAVLERVGPRTHPASFPTRDDEIAWYVNAYNALVLLGVAAHWPIDSVQDVRGTLEPTPGFGFFWAQHFVVEGRSVNLYDFENELREYGDARIHAAINCASESCPDLGGHHFDAERIDAMLDAAARRFVGQDRHVEIDRAREEIVLSSIFTWFDEDFASHARALGAGDTALDWIAHHMSAERRADLAAAREAGYGVRYAEYDWSLNRARAE